MIDGINIPIPSEKADSLQKNPLLKDLWETRLNSKTAAIKEEFVEYRSLIFTKKYNASGYFLSLTGSLHKFAQGDRNHGRFDYQSMINAIEEICQIFDLDLWHYKIDNFEAGVNLILLSLLPSEIMDSPMR